MWRKKKAFWPFFNAITLTQVHIVAIFHSGIGGISLRQPPWKCADCATLIWVQGVCEASQTFPSVEICFARKRALPWQGHRWKMLGARVPQPLRTVQTSPCERSWAMAAKQLEVFFVWIVPRRILRHYQDFRKETGGEEQQSVSHAQICRSQLIAFITALPSLVANLFALPSGNNSNCKQFIIPSLPSH